MTNVPKLDIVLPPAADGASFEMFRTASAPHAQIALPEGSCEADFFVEAANWQLPHTMLSRVRSSAQLHRRGPTEIAAAVAPTLQLYLHVAGEADVVCNGSREQFGPGDIAVKDSGGGYDSKVTAFDIRVLQTARDRVPPIFLSPGVHGLKLPADEAGTRLVAATLETLVREIDELSLSEADHAVSAVWQMAGGVVETQLMRSNQVRRTGAETALDAALAYIAHRLCDADLSSNAVRAYLGISRSALYRLFTPLGGIDAAIRQRRVDEAMRAILNEGGPKLALGALARRYGFAGTSPFVRAFQSRFGTTPTQLQAKIAAGDADWLQAQAARAGFPSLEAWIAELGPGSAQLGAVGRG